jgi:hypothetical protein
MGSRPAPIGTPSRRRISKTDQYFGPVYRWGPASMLKYTRPTSDLSAHDLYLRGYAMSLSSAARFPEALRLRARRISAKQWTLLSKFEDFLRPRDPRALWDPTLPAGGTPRELARAASLPQHGPSARAQEGGAAPCGLTPDRFSLAPCSLGQGRCAPAPTVPPPARGALPAGRSRRRDGHFRSNKGMLLLS